jgi:hypothetical protein
MVSLFAGQLRIFLHAMAKMIIEVGYLIALTLMSAPVLLMLALALTTGKLTWLSIVILV